MMVTIPFRNITKPPVRQIKEYKQRITDIAVAVRSALKGQTNNTLEFTLSGDGIATSTAFDNPDIGPDSVVLFSPITANAAALGVLHVTTTKGAFTVNHAADSNSDLTYRAAVFG